MSIESGPIGEKTEASSRENIAETKLTVTIPTPNGSIKIEITIPQGVEILGDVVGKATERGIKSQKGEELGNKVSALVKNVEQLGKPSIIPPELMTDEYLPQALREVEQSGLLTLRSKEEIQDLLQMIALDSLSKEEIEENREKFSRFKKEIIDRLLCLIDNGANLENSLKIIVSEEISTLENLENIISKIKDNKLDEAIKLLITTVSNAIKKKNIVFNPVYYSSFVKPTVAAVCDRIVTALRNDYVFREKRGEVSESNIEKLLAIINKIKED